MSTSHKDNTLPSAGNVWTRVVDSRGPEWLQDGDGKHVKVREIIPRIRMLQGHLAGMTDFAHQFRRYSSELETRVKAKDDAIVGQGTANMKCIERDAKRIKNLLTAVKTIASCECQLPPGVCGVAENEHGEIVECVPCIARSALQRDAEVLQEQEA